MKFTYYGHSAFKIELNKKHLLFDPFISPNPLASHIDIAKISADYILLSHGHEDHVVDALSIATKTNATLISNFEIVSWYAKQGVKNTYPMNTGGKANFPFGTIKMLHAIHSSVLPDGTYAGNPVGFYVKSNQHSFYYAGDTALTMDMKLINEYYGGVDIAILPVGDHFTMGVEDAIIAAKMINCKKIIGVHYNTFDYIKIDKKAAVNAFAKEGKELILLPIGENIEL